MLTRRICEEYFVSPASGNIDEHAVWIGELKLAVLALHSCCSMARLGGIGLLLPGTLQMTL